MGKLIMNIIIVICVITLIYSNDRIAKQEGSSFSEQILILLVMIGIVYVIIKYAKKKNL
jgi:Ca2+/Na+ antiporter